MPYVSVHFSPTNEIGNFDPIAGKRVQRKIHAVCEWRENVHFLGCINFMGYFNKHCHHNHYHHNAGVESTE